MLGPGQEYFRARVRARVILVLGPRQEWPGLGPGLF